MQNAPGAESLGGAEKSKHRRNYSFQYSTFSPKYIFRSSFSGLHKVMFDMCSITTIDVFHTKRPFERVHCQNLGCFLP